MKLATKCALIAFLVFFILVLIAPLITPYPSDLQDLEHRLEGMSYAHWLGTDHLGRDIASRILDGARLSLGCAMGILGVILLLGLSIGGLCGYIGGKIDEICMRVCDIFLSLPTIALSLFFVGILGAGLENVMIAIALTHWAWYARIVRSLVLSLKQKEYVKLSYTFGLNAFQSFKRHLLPPIFAQCAVLLSLDLGHIMLHIAGLSFLGLGVQPPHAEWGIMMSEAKDYMWDYPLLMLYPGLALFVSVALCNLLGEGLRDYFGVAVGYDDKEANDIKNIGKSYKKGENIENIKVLALRGVTLIEKNEGECGDIYKNKPYKTRALLTNVSFSIPRGECVALLGASGSGKSLSTLFIQGFVSSNLSHKSGEVTLDDETIEARSYRGIAFISIMQNPQSCFNPLLRIHFAFKESLQALQRGYDENLIKECLRDSGLVDKSGRADMTILHKYPFELSGGQLQRVMIALALVHNTPFLIADEPTSDLNKELSEQILEVLINLQQSRGLGILLITHDLMVAKKIAQRVYVMQEGRVYKADGVEKLYKKVLRNASLHSSSHQPQSDSKPILQLSNMNYAYTHFGLFHAYSMETLLQDINLSIYAGDCIAIMGVSGSGKSTLAKILSGLISLDDKGASGELRLHGEIVNLGNGIQRRNFYTQVQILLQDSINSLNPRLNVFENLIEPLIYLRRIKDRARQESMVHELCEDLGLSREILGHSVAMVSGGEAQRICLARALLSGARLLVLDESMSGLDDELCFEVLTGLNTYLKKHSGAMVLITHNEELAHCVCSRVYILEQAKLQRF